jgi:16S rRNA (guanine527-N7)-methyltransferase
MQDRKGSDRWRRRLDELAGVQSAPGGREIIDKLSSYAGEIERWGGRLHLTGRGRIKEAIEEQIDDSLIMLSLYEKVRGAAGRPYRAADVGTGAGFPGIVWKIVRPEMRMDLYERREKIAIFLRRMLAVLEIEDVRVRAEPEKVVPAEERYDVVASKAAGRFDVMLPLAGDMLRRGGIYVTAKGDGWEDELSQAGTEIFHVAGRMGMRGGRGEAVALGRG